MEYFSFFKSKEFISLISITLFNRSNQRHLACFLSPDVLHTEIKNNGLIIPRIQELNIGKNKYWYKNGKLHREEKDKHGLTYPAHIFFMKNDDLVIYRWYKHGKIHRDDRINKKYQSIYSIRAAGVFFADEDDFNTFYTLPARIDNLLLKIHWYQNDTLHRTDKDTNDRLLPAVVEFDASYYYVNGIKVDLST